MDKNFEDKGYVGDGAVPQGRNYMLKKDRYLLYRESDEDAKYLEAHAIEMASHRETDIPLEPETAFVERYRTNEKFCAVEAGLIRAVTLGDIDCVHAALEQGATGDVQNCHGNTAMHLATYALSKTTPNALAIFTTLLEAGLNVNIQNNKGKTPLHIATKYKHRQESLALMQCGARLDLPTASNKTPEYYIQQSDDETLKAYALLAKNHPRTFVALMESLSNDPAQELLAFDSVKRQHALKHRGIAPEDMHPDLWPDTVVAEIRAQGVTQSSGASPKL